jgi:hypothetical protein
MGDYYNANSGQSVRDEDARNMALALTRALGSLLTAPEEAADIDLDAFVWPRAMDDPRPDDGELRRPFVTWAGALGRERIQGLIAFCGAGGFRIS